MISPLVKGYLTNPFSTKHFAIDVGWGKLGISDPPVRTCLSGIVLKSDYETQSGNNIYIRHDLNTEYCILIRYCHLKTRSVLKGSPVTEGQYIGIGGNTGSLSTGAHLHWELWLVPSSVLDHGIPPIKDKLKYAFDPRSMLSTNSLTGEGFHLITLTEPTLPIAITAVSNLSYRLSPSLKGKRLGSLKQNLPYPYLGQTDLIDNIHWAKLVINDMIVYSSMQFLALTVPPLEKPVHILLQDAYVKVQVDSI